MTRIFTLTEKEIKEAIANFLNTKIFDYISSEDIKEISNTYNCETITDIQIKLIENK